jgi:hypothetical protein
VITAALTARRCDEGDLDNNTRATALSTSKTPSSGIGSSASPTKMQRFLYDLHHFVATLPAGLTVTASINAVDAEFLADNFAAIPSPRPSSSHSRGEHHSATFYPSGCGDPHSCTSSGPEFCLALARPQLGREVAAAAQAAWLWSSSSRSSAGYAPGTSVSSACGCFGRHGPPSPALAAFLSGTSRRE